jgi:flagellar basal-body rod modification protein FlgD
MAAGVTGVWNQLVNRAVNGQATNAPSSGQSSSSTGSSTTIAANDFLTLLVTEMKNQDPTATTDPNEYVNQLVQVNSLQQLIAINETLQKTLTTPAKTELAPRTVATRTVANGPARDHAATVAAPSKAAGETESRDRSSAALQIATALTR